MKQSARGLRAQLLLLVLLALIPAFGLIAYTAVKERRNSVAQMEEDALKLVRLVAREQERLFVATGQLLASISKLPEAKSPAKAAACHHLLAELIKPHPYYTNFGVIGADGAVFCSAVPLARDTYAGDRSYFQRALGSRGLGIGDFQVGRLTGVPAINIGQAVLSDSGAVQAVVFAALDLRWLNRLIADAELPAGSVITVFDSGGTVLARHPDPEQWVGRSYRDAPLIGAALTRRTEGTAEIEGLDGTARLYAFAPVIQATPAPVFLTLGVPKRLVLAKANEAFMRNLIALLGVMGLALLAAWIGGDILVLRGVNALTEAARRIRAGDLTPLKLRHSTGEIGELSRVFEDMAGSLSRINRAHKTLSETKRLVLCATDERNILSEMCRLIVRQVGYRVALLAYAGEDERRSLLPVAQEGFIGGISALKKDWESISWAEGGGPTATAIRTGKPYVAQYLLTDPNFAPWLKDAARHGVASLAVFPVSIDGRVIGALAIYAAEPNAFEQQELDLLTEAVQDLSVGIALLRARLEQGRAHATIERMAHYDRLTGLPNHALFEQRLRRLLAEARSFDRVLGLFIIDLMRLRDINDAFGFQQGDQLIKEVGVRIGRILRPGDLFARMRSDEFALLCVVDDAEDAERVARQIIEAASVPFMIGSVSVEINVTVGVSLYPDHGKDGQQLMRHADVAMHEAKKAQVRYAFYRQEQDENRAQRLAMVGELRHAIEANELSLFYQPKVSISTGRLCGLEALVRWMHPKRGTLPPDEFISLAEQSGLIKPLTEWVIGAALRQSAVWRNHGVALPVAVNLSAYDLRDQSLVQKIEQLLRESGAEPEWLELEITEGAVMEDPKGALEILTRLRDMGITLFIDDFGTGYSSLGYLKKLPVDAVKIDRSFVTDMTEDQDSEAIVRTTIGLGHELGLAVVAEGVETDGALNRLTKLGCDVVQGYHISRPLPAEAVHEWILKTKWSSASPANRGRNRVRGRNR